MTNARKLEEAIYLASDLHRFQTDAAGEPYILHPLRVMSAVRGRGGNTNAQIAAVLHDVVEDTSYTLKDIYLQFGLEVNGLVDALSRRPAYTAQWTPNLIGMLEEPYPEFIDRVLEAGRVAIIIKECDIFDNMSRLDGISDPAKRERLRLKYSNALEKIHRHGYGPAA